MPITYRTGNLLDDDAYALVNPCNAIGAAGKGLSLAFKRRFPTNFYWYRLRCNNDEEFYSPGFKIGKFSAGMIYTIKNLDGGTTRFIVNFATKEHWRDPSRLEWIDLGLRKLRRLLSLKYSDRLEYPSIAIPKLGCGEGGLAWNDVRPLIEAALGDLECDVRVYV